MFLRALPSLVGKEKENKKKIRRKEGKEKRGKRPMATPHCLARSLLPISFLASPSQKETRNSE